MQLSVRQCPSGNIKTGLLSTPPNNNFSLLNAATGQTPYSSNSKMSTNSPSLALLFGVFTWIKKLLPSNDFMSDHNSVSSGQKLYLFRVNNSPNLIHPKKASKAAVQTICLLVSVQLVFAIWFPKIISRGSDITFLEWDGHSSYISKFCTPWISLLVKKLLHTLSSKFLSLCTVANDET